MAIKPESSRRQPQNNAHHPTTLPRGILKVLDRSSASTTSSSDSSSCVRFDTVTIREYCLTIGDNPSCSGGAPLSLGWSYSETYNLPLETYEENRPPRRERIELIVPRHTRHAVLMKEWGFSFSSIITASRQALQAQQERNRRENPVEFIESTIWRLRMRRRKRKLKNMLKKEKSRLATATRNCVDDEEEGRKDKERIR